MRLTMSLNSSRNRENIDMPFGPLKQSRLFQVRLTPTLKATLLRNHQQFGHHYGVFFDTSGWARVERINPTAQYNYIWRTDEALQTKNKNER